jgi:hypothetical protein
VARGVEVAGDPALVGERRELDGIARGRMAGGHRDIEVVLEHQRQLDAGVRRARAEVVAVDHGDVDLAELQRRQCVLGLELGQRDLGGGVVGGEARHGARRDRRGGGRESGQAHGAAHLAGIGRELGLGCLQLGEHALGAPDEQPRGGRERDPPPLSLEQRDADLALEGREVLRDRGRRVSKRPRGRGDRAALGELAEHVQAADVEHAKAQLMPGVRIRKWK